MPCPPSPPQGPPGIKLYEFVRSSAGAATWSLLTGHAAPRFYDANGEDSSAKKAEWMIEVGLGGRARFVCVCAACVV